MTVEDTQRVRAVTKSIVEASSPDVQADIDALQNRRDRPAWLQEASQALGRRYGGLISAQPRSLEAVAEGVPPRGIAPAPVGVDETIVYAIGTPVFLVKNNTVDITSARAEATAWRQILAANANILNRGMVSIGRIDATNYENSFVGTAWVIDDGLVVTNRHVASLFAEASGIGFKFKLGFDARNPIGISVDFLEELGNNASDEIRIDRVVWVAPDGGPDVAFLKLEQTSTLAGRQKLDLSDELPRAKLPVAVIGYPASDPRFSDQDLAQKIFGGIFDKKRAAVGNILGVGSDQITHSCSTLGGNSGSPVLDIGTGKVVAMHYRGIEFIENDAVPVAVLRRCLIRARGLLEARNPDMTSSENESNGASRGVGCANRAGSLSFTVPLRITVEIADNVSICGSTGQPVAATAITPAPTAQPPSSGPPTEDQGPISEDRVRKAVRDARSLLANREDVVAIKAGYRFQDGQITDQRAVVIAVKRKIEKGALLSRGIMALPSVIGGVPTDVTVATTADLLGLDGSDEAALPSWHTRYTARPDLPLTRRTTKTKFVIHSGPDASWPQLGPFLAQTKKSLVIAMYDLGAVNVVNGLLDAVKGNAETISMVLQMGGKVHEGDLTDYESVAKIRDEKDTKFDFAPASVGKAGIFDSAYHIKVAVRDHTSMWLSSGNWQSSNQPDIDPLKNKADATRALRQYNREWHAILEDLELSKLYEAHILRDLEEAKAAPEGAADDDPLVFVPADMAEQVVEAAQKPRYFSPLVGDREIDVQPILTPDNYIEQVVPFIQTAKRKLYFQNQSFGTRTIGERYRTLLDALLAKQQAGVDVRIIFRSFGPDDRDTISNAKDYGFDTKSIRKQRNCHTKGIIIDGDAVLMGSHNWTTAGTTFNRDASLIFYDTEIAKFYEDLFLYDWERIGPAKVDESLPAPIIVPQGSGTKAPPGYVSVPLSIALGR